MPPSTAIYSQAASELGSSVQPLWLIAVNRLVLRECVSFKVGYTIKNVQTLSL